MFASIAESAGYNLMVIMCVIAFGIWGFRRMFRQFDSKGEIKGAATKGIVSMIGRWLK